MKYIFQKQTTNAEAGLQASSFGSLWKNKVPLPVNRRYSPWEFMLHIDDVNYSIDEQLHTLVAQHVPLINLASGVNFVPPPTGYMEEIGRALTHTVFYQDYDGYKGTIVGRRAIQCFESIRSQYNINLTDDHIMVTSGAGAALHLLSLYFGDTFSSDTILIPVPTFPLVAAAMKAAGLEVREVEHVGLGRFLPIVEEFAAAITARTRFIYVNLFNNPTGECYSRQEFARLIALAKRHGIIVLVDRVSSDLDVSGSLPNVLDVAVEQDYLDGLVVVSSLSKDRGLPGLRIGWIIGSPTLIEHLAYYNSLIAMSSPTLGGAVLYIDMLCRATLHGQIIPKEDIRTRAISMATRFYEHTIPLADLAHDLRDFLNLLKEPERVVMLVENYSAWQSGLEQQLRQNWEILRDEYSHIFVGALEWKGDFNTFIRIPALDHEPVYETTISMFRQHGLQILPGPVFGFDVDHWRHLGFWTRLSFALPTEQWRKGLSVLSQFANSRRGS